MVFLHRALVLEVLAFVLVLGEIKASNWKRQKDSHLSLIEPVSSLNLTDLALNMADGKDFNDTLEAIAVPRVPGSLALLKVEQFITNKLEKLGWTVDISSSRQMIPNGSMMHFRNIIATLDPTAPRRLVLACHYDSKINPEGFVGATDSAVPCSQMLNLAQTMDRALKRQENPKVTLQLIFFDGEEAIEEWKGNDNTYGSRALAKEWSGQKLSIDGVTGTTLDRIDLFVLLDLIGTSDTKFSCLIHKTGDWYKQLVTIEETLLRKGLLEGTNTLFVPTTLHPCFMSAGGVADDHIHFERRGVPITHLISVPFPKVWHTIDDNLSNLDWTVIENMNKILRTFVALYLQL